MYVKRTPASARLRQPRSCSGSWTRSSDRLTPERPSRPVKSSFLLAVGGVLLIAACAPNVQGQAVASLPADDDYSLPQLAAPRPIQQSEYAARRAALARGMEDGVFVAFGSAEPELDFLPYGQNSNFRYLTGVLEPEAALVLVKEGGRVGELLFVQARDPAQEVWEGERLGADGASALTGMN